MTYRIEKCLTHLYTHNLDALLVSHPTNITYLSGFREAEGYLLLSGEKVVYITNPLYAQEAKKISLWEVIVYEGNLFETVAKIAHQLKLNNVGYEAKHLCFLEYKYLRQHLKVREINFLKTEDIIETVRAIKTKKEIASIREAVDITVQGLAFVEEIFDERFSEKQLSLEIEKFIKFKGDIDCAFPPIVAFGKNASMPHHIPSDERIGRDKIFLTDFGAKRYGYCADLTRVFFLSKMPIYIKKIYAAVKGAADLAIKKIKPGIKANELDRYARDYIHKKGFGKYFCHGLGHGVGLEVHEKPFLNSRNEEILHENMVVTIEPAVYVPDKCGIRLESMVLIKSGGAEVLDGVFHR